jgi:hypothetical protein
MKITLILPVLIATLFSITTFAGETGFEQAGSEILLASSDCDDVYDSCKSSCESLKEQCSSIRDDRREKACLSRVNRCQKKCERYKSRCSK